MVNGHKRVVGSCGHLIASCRCPGPHTTSRVERPCAACVAKTASAKLPAPIETGSIDCGRPDPPPIDYDVTPKPGVTNLATLVAVVRVPHRCPICDGRTRVPSGFYGETKNASAEIICQTCHGAGIVWAPGG